MAQSSASGIAMALAYQPDHDLLVGGQLSYLNGQRRENLGRFNLDRALDLGFVPSDQGWVSSVVVTWDERILVGGSFPEPTSASHFNLRRLNPDGTADYSFAIRAKHTQPGELVGSVCSVLIQQDGKIVVAGSFDKLTGQLRQNIGRLHPDGTLDATFNPKVSGNPSFVSSMALQPDGKILVAGYFARLGGRACTNLGRINPDGTLDPSFRARPSHAVRTVCLQPDGRLLIGGVFARVNGWNRRFLARLFPNGDVDTGFNPRIEPPGLIGAINAPGIYTIGLQSDGRIIFGGRFSRVGGVERKHLARINADGSLNVAFSALVSGKVDTRYSWPIAPAVYGLALQEGGGVVLGGYFTHVNGEAHRNIACWPVPEPVCVDFLHADTSRQVVTWERCGSSPELDSVIFEQSIDGIHYDRLGSGTRIFGGWEIRDVALPMAPVTIRARGRTWSGVGNCSSGLVSVSAEL